MNNYTFPDMTDSLRMGFVVGDRVRRTQGRPQNVGREGVITWLSRDHIGGGGDILVKVTADDGDEWTAYVRQLAKI